MKIFDKEKFANTVIDAWKKLKLTFKELSKCAGVGMAFGVAAGTALGLVLNKVFNNK